MIRLRIAFAVLFASTALPALAADPQTLDQRVDRVEKQLKAVQRKVFPGGDAAFQAPEIAPPEIRTAAGAPASTPLSDFAARIDALEKSLAELTGQVEQDSHRLDLLSQQAAQDRQEFAVRLKALEAAAAPVAASVAPVLPEESRATASTAAAPVKGKAPGPFPPPKSTPATASPKPAPAHNGSVADAGSGATGDAAEDAYMAGYKLWSQKKYPEARAALAAVVKKYPTHKRTSYAQNLLGRSYLDDGQPARAAEAFAANYTTNPRGERAPDSLYFLGQSLFALKKPTDACRVYDELTTAYGAKIDASLKAKVTAARAEAKCK